MDSCPKELEPYDLAYEKKIKERDALMYAWWGNYGLSALSVAIEHCLGGKKAKSEYIKEPMFSKIGEKKQENKPLSEEDKIKQTELLFAKLNVLSANHRLSKKKESD